MTAGVSNRLWSMQSPQEEGSTHLEDQQAKRMNGSALLARLNFFQAAPGLASRGPSIAVSEALLAASRMDEDALWALLRTSPEGLDTAEAEARLASIGPNLIAQEGRPSLAQELWGRARNPLNMLLLCLAVVSYFLGDHGAAVVIMVIVALAIAMAFIQEHRSNDAAAKLRALVKTTASVKRRGSPTAEAQECSNGFCEIPIEQLVPGDIVRLSAGDIIPGDTRLLAAKDLFIDQAALTGEAMPFEKSAQPGDESGANPFDAHNLCFMGSSVVSGFATGVIVQTGAKTYFGQLAERIAERRALTNFDKGINRFTWLMIRFMLVLAPSVFLINGLTKGDWLEALLFALAVAVGLAPELLPMIVTVNLAKGAIEMSKKRVIVKRLNAIQNFGAMDVLCADKTGTLTQNRIALSLHLDVRGKESERVLEYAYLNSRFQSGLKSQLDAAVLQHVELDHDLLLQRQYKNIDEIPFDFVRRRLSVVLSRDEHGRAFTRGWLARAFGRIFGNAHVLICKGAVEEVLSICKYYELEGKVGILNPARRADALAKIRALNEDGFRVVAVAYKKFASPRKSYAIDDEIGLTLLGFIAFLDPPKDSVGDAMAALNQAGVAVKILTGDNEIVTRKICREVGLEIDHIALGPDIENLTDAALANLAETGHGLRQGVAGAEGAHRRRAPFQWPRGRLSRRRHQRQPSTQSRGRRRLRRYGGRHRQGVGGHHPA